MLPQWKLFLVCLCVFISLLKSTTTLVFEFVWNPELDNDTRLLVALFLVHALSSPLCLPLLGKVPFTLWRWLWTMGQIPWAVFCCFPHSGKLLSVPVIFGPACKLGLIDRSIFSVGEPRAHCDCELHDGQGGVFVRMFSIFFFLDVLSAVLVLASRSQWWVLFLYNLTSFIFSRCGITICCWNVSLTQMGDRDRVCHGESGKCVVPHE